MVDGAPVAGLEGLECDVDLVKRKRLASRPMLPRIIRVRAIFLSPTFKLSFTVRLYRMNGVGWTSAGL